MNDLSRISIKRKDDGDGIAKGYNIQVLDADGKEIKGIKKVAFECEGGKAAEISLTFYMDLVDVDGLLTDVAILQHEHADTMPLKRTIRRVT